MRTTIEVDFPSTKIAKAAQRAILIEAGQQKKSFSKILRRRNELKIVIDAQDIAALHATVGSFMRALKVFLAVAAHKV